jgi:hypothetical protein
MTKQQESEILTRVGPGTPMGNVLRHYWFPALKSSELVPDGAPVRFLLLGEQLIAFRDTQGRIGIMDHRCPHGPFSITSRRFHVTEVDNRDRASEGQFCQRDLCDGGHGVRRSITGRKDH